MFPIIYKCSIYFENVMYAIIIPLYIRSITSNCITINIHLSLILLILLVDCCPIITI